MGHYIENTGDEPVMFLEMFRSDHFADFSLSQWMALTPPQMVRDHLNLDMEMIAALCKDKAMIVPWQLLPSPLDGGVLSTTQRS
jgi:oxalate decarboxylase